MQYCSACCKFSLNVFYSPVCLIQLICQIPVVLIGYQYQMMLIDEFKELKGHCSTY